MENRGIGKDESEWKIMGDGKLAFVAATHPCTHLCYPVRDIDVRSFGFAAGEAPNFQWG
jgi:hypothetical protein